MDTNRYHLCRYCQNECNCVFDKPEYCGIKDDNRPENLELWLSSQPSGQRVEDLVKWAKEILEKYGEINDVARFTG